MKTKKPSLLDMECFVQARTKSSPVVKNEPEIPVPPKKKVQRKEKTVGKTDPEVPATDREDETARTVDPAVEKIETQTGEVTSSKDAPSDSSDADVLTTIKMMLTDIAPKKDTLQDIMSIVTEQKMEIVTLKIELSKLKSQVEAFNIIADQKVEIKNLRNKVNTLQTMFDQFAENKNVRPVKKAPANDDENYKILIFKNIIKMKDENGFSSLDVAKLFKREGFPVFSPYETWDEDTVTQMYKLAKSFSVK